MPGNSIAGSFTIVAYKTLNKLATTYNIEKKTKVVKRLYVSLAIIFVSGLWVILTIARILLPIIAIVLGGFWLYSVYLGRTNYKNGSRMDGKKVIDVEYREE